MSFGSSERLVEMGSAGVAAAAPFLSPAAFFSPAGFFSDAGFFPQPVSFRLRVWGPLQRREVSEFRLPWE